MLKPCPSRFRVTDERSWYTPAGKTTGECTYCEECFDKFVKNTPEASSFTKHNNLTSCNCDYPRDYTKYGIEKDGLRVTIASKKGSLFQKIDNQIANLNGVMHVDVPTCTEYMIFVDKTDSDENSYFTFESGKVGSKEITINNGRLIYYPSNVEIKGFKTGTNESFMFISPSNQEKSEGRKTEGENETNIITLKLKKWIRRPSRSSFFGARTRGYSRGYDESYGGEDLFLSASYDNFTLQCKGGPKSASLTLCSNSRGGDRGSNLTGGATVSGGSFVDNVRTSYTDDNFESVGTTIEFMVQLVCSQTDEEKYQVNSIYHMKQDLAAREELLNKISRSKVNMESFEAQIKSLEKKIEHEKTLVDQLSVELKKYEYLGSTDKQDHLLKFEQDGVKVVNLN